MRTFYVTSRYFTNCDMQYHTEESKEFTSLKDALEYKSRQVEEHKNIEGKWSNDHNEWTGVTSKDFSWDITLWYLNK